MYNFIAYFLVYYWAILLIYRLNLPTKLYNLLPNAFIDELTNCEFCIESHVSLVFALFFYYFSGDNSAILYYFMCPALSNILKR